MRDPVRRGSRRVGQELAARDPAFLHCMRADTSSGAGPYLLTVRAMQAAGITEKNELLPTLARLTSRLPDDVLAQRVHKIQGMKFAPSRLEVLPGSWWDQLVGDGLNRGFDTNGVAVL